MTKYEEVLLEIEGKIAYADSTGNMTAKHELSEMSVAIKKLMEEKAKNDEISGGHDHKSQD